jgi:23S rRNA (cytosine1962-C5)-methyltransferase
MPAVRPPARAEARVVLKPGKEKSLARRHPWIYATAIGRVEGAPQPGETVVVRSHDGRFLARAAFSPASAIRARAWTFDETQPVDAALIAHRLREAIARRASLAARTDAVRLVFGEADQLPGLVVDRYGDRLVVQLLAAGVEAWRDTIVAELIAATGCADLYERSDAAARERESLAPREGPLAGRPPEGPVDVCEDGVRYRVDIVGGHKTGFYIDQRDNRRLVAEHARGRSLLNCFCYTGGFTIAARRAGAGECLSIDSSEPALAQARDNEALNGLAPSEWRAANVFDGLKGLLAEGRRFGTIVLDPPKFAPSAHHLDRATRAYKEINMKALRLLEPGGWLFTFSCSGAVSVDLFQKVVAGAVIDAGVDAQLVGRLQAGADHPMLMTHPEGEYLKGLLLRRV